MVVGLAHARGGTLDLLLTDVPDLVRVTVVAPLGSSDHSSLSAIISMAQDVPNLCACREVIMKQKNNCIAVVPSPGVKVALPESMNCDLWKVSDWRDLKGMKLNASKTKTMIVCRSHTMHPQLPVHTFGGTLLKESDDQMIYFSERHLILK